VNPSEPTCFSNRYSVISNWLSIEKPAFTDYCSLITALSVRSSRGIFTFLPVPDLHQLRFASSVKNSYSSLSTLAYSSGGIMPKRPFPVKLLAHN